MKGAGLVVSLAGLLATGCSETTPCELTEGVICTIAGNGDIGYSGEDGPALAARLGLPMDTLASPDGNLYILDWNNHRIRKLTPDGTIHFVAGNGELGGGLDDPATGALNHPTNMTFDPTGTRIYIAAWHNSKILALDPETGLIVETCGDGRRAYFGDGGAALTSTLDLPSAIAWSPNGDLAILDQANQVIRAIDAAGTINTIAGQCVIDGPPPIGPGACAPGVVPVACPAPSGKYTCGDPATTCSTMPCWSAYAGDGLPATQMRMAQGVGQATDPGGRLLYDREGSLYFADVSNHMIRKIDAEGIVHRVAGLPPEDGRALSGYAGDGGPATEALLKHPIDLALADDGTIYVTDVFNHCVRAIAPDQTIRTVVGVCGTKGYAGDGGPAEAALLNRPYGVEWVAPNTLYIADTFNSVIRAVTLP